MSLDRLTARLLEEDRLIVAFSGGADSALLTAVAHRVLGDRMLAATAISASFPEAERTAARRFVADRGIPYVEVCTREFERPEYLRNGADRCFHCKSALFDALEPLATLSSGRVALGTNLDDLGEHRPGQAAAVARKAVFPLVDAGLTKADVRVISAELGLTTASKPAAACLSSRVVYGDAVTVDLLARIERAEASLRDLGFSEFRVRTHGDGMVARLEVSAAEMRAAYAMREALASLLLGAGFAFAALDLVGFRSGSMSRVLRATRRNV